METFIIDNKIAGELIEHARQSSPQEACGMIGGLKNEASQVYPLKNIEESELTYAIDPKEAFSVIKQMRSEGVEFIASYHSHPATEAYPSPTDRAKASSLSMFYVIVSLRNPSSPKIRAFKISDDKVVEAKVDKGD